MRTIFWILLLANVAFFAAMQQGWFKFSDEREVQTLPALHEEKIRLLEMPKSAAVAAVTIVTPVIVPETAATSAAAASPKVESKEGMCVEWGDFSGADLTRATTVLAGLKLGDKLGQRQIERNIGYWVYMGPLQDKAAVDQKILQLKARKVDEYFVVQEEGQWLNTISLGVFKTEEAARKFLEELSGKDVRTAKIGERASKLKSTVFVLNNPDAVTIARLAAIKKDFSGSELKNVPCASILP